MPDVKEVINGLEMSYKYSNVDENNTLVPKWIVLHALALLKAQEPVEPVLDIDTWKCGNCGHTLENQQLLGDNVLFHEQYNFCPNCGRAVKLC